MSLIKATSTDQVLRIMHAGGHRGMWAHSHSGDTTGPGQDTTTSRYKTIHGQLLSLAVDIRQRRSPRRLLRMVPHVGWVQFPGHGQVRVLRGIQTHLRRQRVPQLEPHTGLPRGQRQCRVHRRHLPLPFRGDQGAHADDATTIRQHAAPGLVQGRREGRHRRSLQGHHPALGPPDPLHHVQIRHL